MSVNSVQQFLNVRDSHLRVVSGNVHADQMVIGGITVDTSHGLQSVTDTSNVTTNTIEFSNATTAFVTTANAAIGGNTTIGANATIGGDLTVSGNTFYSNNTSINIDSNVVAEFTGPHTRLPKEIPLKKYPEIAFISNEGVGGTYDRYLSSSSPFDGIFIQAGYVVSSSSNYSASVGQGAWNLFAHRNSEPGDNYSWYSEYATNYDGAPAGSYSYSGGKNLGTGAVDGEWVKIEMPKKIRLKNYILWGADLESEFPQDWTLYGSNNGTSWSSIHSKNGQTIGSGAWSITYNSATGKFVNLDVTSSDYYKYFALVFTRAGARNDYIGIGEWELYGYEEDPPAGDISVDTTFKSILNTPQTTRANVYVDAKLSSDFTNQVTGPTPVGTTVTHDNTNKYWEMNGQLTSNITVEANTFLEGDQPHAVSVWFNSSNLEANVSNTCVFSISDQEKLDSVNLDLQSNTWHNLTYAYQGEGGSRVTYLDGRKVAEEQAEDTFGDYPPFAMTGYSQGGYVASASSMFGTTTYPYLVFDNNTNPNDPYRWVCEDNKYTTGGSYDGTESHTDVDGNVEEGEWLKIELPHKLKVSYFEITPYPIDGSQSWRNYAILGSNDDSTWYQVQKVSGLSNANGLTAGSVVPTGTYKNSAFKYFVFIWGNKNADGNRHVAMGELKLYGHRENDLVRLPDPTNVLKYPHIVMSEYAKRGYVIEASSYFDEYFPYNAFNEKFTLSGNEPAEHVWTSNATYTGGGGLYNTSQTHGIGTTYGEFLKLTLPHKLKPTKARIYPRTYGSNIGNGQSPAQFKIFGSNDNFATFVELYHQNTDWVNNGTWGEFTISTTDSFKHIGIVFTKTNGQTTVGIQALEYYGTGVDSIPIQIGGGNIDKVANFRVYDKFIDENQVLEIWDAQKDEFGRAKSSMTLHKGRLGIGTTEPEGRLAVLDEPNELEEFPPGAMTGYKNYFEGHGEFRVSWSSNPPNDPHLWYGWQVFDRVPTTNIYLWHSGGGYSSSGTYEANGTRSLGGYIGDWVRLDMPYKINLTSFRLRGRDGIPSQSPKSFVIIGSDTGNEWDVVFTTQNAGLVDTVSKNFTVNSTNYYKYYALVVGSIDGSYTSVGVSEWRLFGTREQGQSVLHDGQLTLTKNLNVPRIGPAPDVDDTPRRDRLVVEYNTSTNPMFEGAVRDTSGRGNDGVFYGNATYDATEKALVFDGTDDTIRGTQNIGTGEKVLTMAMWFKRTVAVNTYDYVCTIGTSTTGQMAGFTINSNKFNFTKYGAQTLSTTTINNGQWYHVVGVYKGGNWDTTNTEIYVNGVKETITGGTSSALNLTGNQITFGDSTLYDGTSSFNGQISNFKLYDTALTAEEVKTLYDMGRCDEGHHVVNFSKTRVGIGLVDGEAPSGVLDVRGGMYLNGILLRMFDGSSPDKAAISAKYIQEMFNRTTDGAYWINVPSTGPRQIFCIMNPSVNGGGWMMTLKGTRGSTFNYSASYWTTDNVLNETDATRDDADAKYETYNKYTASEWLAVFPDTSVAGGDVPGGYAGGWTWHEQNPVGLPMTLLHFYTNINEQYIKYIITGATVDSIREYSRGQISPFNIKKFNSSLITVQYGYSGATTGMLLYAVNYKNGNNATKWGFSGNNESDQSSNDSSFGIGINSLSYSAGDVNNCCPVSTGLNRSMRFEWYIR